MAFLEVKNLKVKIEDKEILKGISLEVNKNEVVALNPSLPDGHKARRARPHFFRNLT